MRTDPALTELARLTGRADLLGVSLVEDPDVPLTSAQLRRGVVRVHPDMAELLREQHLSTVRN